jgi:biotin carboxylase
LVRTVVFAAPFPLETTLRFARAAARLPGVRLVGVAQEVPHGADRSIFADIVQVRDGLATGQLIEAIDVLRRRYGGIHRIVGVLEPLQVQLAQARAHFGVPGTDPDTADLFRDKARMKDRLRESGLPVARHALIRRSAEADAFAERVGFPMVVKPPAGMGAKATFRVRSREELLRAVEGMAASPERPVLAEEFLVGEEGSFDTVTVDGVVRGWSISHYRPSCLEVLENPWIQWCCVFPRHVETPELAPVHDVGVRAIRALGLKDGITHMEWFKRRDGSVAIGEIAQRPPGANISKMIGIVNDIDPYRAWARAVIDGEFDGPWQRRWAAGTAYLRGMGRGRVVSVTGVAEANDAVRQWVVDVKLPTIGAPKNDSYEGDGYAIVRDPSTEVVERVLTKIIETVRIHYA